MSCHDARESLSAFLDEALAPDERQRVAQHLEGCSECQRELARLEQTVALLHRVEPVRAPVGFVDAVTAAARPRPWYRRVAAAVFLPFPVKLPAEATALLMVALLAVYVFERTPALRESARTQPEVREDPREKTVRPAPRGLTDRFARDPSSAERSPESKARPLEKEQDRREAPTARERIASEAETPKQEAAPAPAAPRLDTAPPVAAPPAATAPAAPASPAPGAAPPAAKDEGAFQKSQAENRQAPVPPTAEGSRGAPPAPRLAAKRAAPSADAVTGIAVRDRDAAERDLAELIARVGGRETGRRREQEATIVEAVVPQPRYAEFTQSLARLGAWRVEAERPDLPAQVHVILRLQ